VTLGSAAALQGSGGASTERRGGVSVEAVAEAWARLWARKKQDILKGYPTLTKEGLDAALEFAARQFEGEEIKVLGG